MKNQDNLEKEKQLNFKIKKEVCSNNNQDFIVFFTTESENKLSIKAIKYGLTKIIYSKVGNSGPQGIADQKLGRGQYFMSIVVSINKLWDVTIW